MSSILNATRPPAPPCNLCGEPCTCEHAYGPMGLIGCEVSGGYESTPGNGCGALDDTRLYKFSLCEFCLDWLFSQFKRPPEVISYIGDGVESFRPAEQRVREDEWRRAKDRFFAENLRRSVLRGKR